MSTNHGIKSKKKEREEFTKQWMANPENRIAYYGELFCSCSQYPYPHKAHTDELGIFEYHRSLREEK